MNRRHVVIIGAGVAGLTAAHAALDNGAVVTVIDVAASVNEAGGNTKYSGGVVRVPHAGLEDLSQLVTREGNGLSVAPYSEQALLSDLTKEGPEQEEHRRTVHTARRTVNFLIEHGARFRIPVERFAARAAGESVVTIPPGLAIEAVGRGQGLVQQLLQALLARSDVQCVWATRVSQFLQDRRGIAGVLIADGELQGTLNGRVIVASGGFQGSKYLRETLLGVPWDRARLLGAPENRGEMLLGVLQAGGKGVGPWTGCSAAPVDARMETPHSPGDTYAAMRVFTHVGVVVNQSGQRFINEHAAPGYLQSGCMARAIAGLGSPAYQIIDSTMRDRLAPSYWDSDVPGSPDLASLARSLGVRRGALDSTLRNLNRIAGDVGRPTALEGAEVAVPYALTEPPFFAWPLAAGIRFTYGGVESDARGRVVRGRNTIDGLYAAGEIRGGFFSGEYPVGSSLLRAAASGIAAGRSAAASNDS